MSVSVDRSSLTFVTVNAAPTSQAVRLTLTGGSGTYYAAVVLDREGLLDTYLEFTGPTTATVLITTLSPPLGTTSGNVAFMLCRDAGCGSVAWSKAVPYTVRAFAVAPSTLAFTGTEGAAATAQTITVTPADDLGALAATPSASWIAVARDGASAWRVTPSAQALLAGSHQGNIVVGPTSGGSRHEIPVAFTVATGMVPPADATHVVDLRGITTGTIPVAFRAGIGPAWSATEDRAWLTLTRGSGTGEGTVQYAIDVAQLAVANWASDVATVQIASPGLTPLSVHLTASKQLPDVFMVSPAAIRAGEASTVEVFGRGLSQIRTEDGIAVSGASGASTTVVSDTRAVVAVPATAAGTATVSVPNPHSIPTGSADLAVAAAGTWTAGKVANVAEIGSAVLDPVRAAIFAAGFWDDTVYRYRFAAGSWEVDAVAVASLVDVGLSADRSTLYVTAGDPLYGDGTLRTLHPDTLQLGPTHDIPSSSGSILGSSRSGLQATNDARLWFHGSQWSSLTYFDLVAGEFVNHPGAGEMLYSARVFASPDGSRMLVTQNADTAYAYSSAEDRLTAPAIAKIYGDAVWSRDGSVLMADGDVYDTATWTIRGRVGPDATGEMTTWAQLSPDGSKAYVLVHSITDASYPVLRVDVLDTTSVVSGTTHLVKLGEITVTDRAADCGTQHPYGCSFIPRILVGPLGDVLFLVGNQGLAVVPVPPALAGAP